MFQIDYRNGVSICDQIITNIIRLKSLGILSGGTQLPSVRILASKLSVNPNTVQKAYSLLEAEGIICTVRGKGSFVCDDDAVNNAIKENAKAEFLKAVKTAVELGITKNELNGIVNSFEEEKK